MTAEKDPRIEAVAKLLFTSPIYQHNVGDWETDRSDYYYDRRMCLMAAEDVLRGIDEAAGCETVADLDGLPDRAVVRDRTGAIYEKQVIGDHTYWLDPGREMPSFSSLIELPAQILWVPGEEKFPGRRCHTVTS